MSETNMFGKTYNTVGSTNSNFIIKTKGDLKILWGNKYIDLIKNGKIVSKSEGFLYLCASPEEIKKDGIYLIEDSVWVSYKGLSIELKNSENAYISFMRELADINSDLKQTALKNIGFYYDTLEDAKLDNLQNGIVFIILENKLYAITNGIFLEYGSTITTVTDLPNGDNVSSINDVVVTDSEISMNINSNPIVIVKSDLVSIQTTMSVLDIVSKSFSIETKDDKSTLIVDSINWKDISDSTTIGKIQETNIVELKNCPSFSEPTPTSGIYSKNFIGLNSKLYDTVFKKRCSYPRYDLSMQLPEIIDDPLYDMVVPSLDWVKLLLNMLVPSGTIVMWSGSSIPSGWAICNGENGTPNLIGKFIKASESSGEIGGSNTITIQPENLPNHEHTIPQLTSENTSIQHSHSITLLPVVSDSASFDIDSLVWKKVPQYMLINFTTTGTINCNISFKDASTNKIIQSCTVTEPINYYLYNISDGTIVNVECDDTNIEIVNNLFSYRFGTDIVVDIINKKESTSNKSQISKVDLLPDVVAIGEDPSRLKSGDFYLDNKKVTYEHTHNIDINNINTDIYLDEGHNHIIKEHTTSNTTNANNVDLNIEPEYYSLIFIMKL